MRGSRPGWVQTVGTCSSSELGPGVAAWGYLSEGRGFFWLFVVDLFTHYRMSRTPHPDDLLSPTQ